MIDRHELGERIGHSLYIGGMMFGALAILAFCAVKAEASENVFHRYAKQGRNSTSLNGVVAPLASKVRELQRECGSKIVSTIRRGARTPSGRVSNHDLGRAADLQGNPRCVYDRLKGWPGGVSTDYARAPGGPHVHISYNPNMEWGLRFAHRGGSKRVRYAKQNLRREASAQ